VPLLLNNQISPAKLLLSTLTILLFSISAFGCEPGADLTIANHTDQVLRITIGRTGLGEVAPGAEIITFYLFQGDSPIVATNPQGQIVYSKEFKNYELAKMKGRVIISPDRTGIGGPNDLIIDIHDFVYSTITINEQFVAKVKSWTKIKVGYEIGSIKYLIEIKDINGQIIYSKEFTGDELLKMGGEIIIEHRP
jgi:hypothetical protein